jgi:DNA-binding MarR family transcriptional regulator
VVSQLYDHILAPSGLKSTQYSLLRIIGLAPVTIGELARFMDMDRTTLARNVRLLERNHYLNITAGEDKRTRLLSLTRKGSNAVKDATRYWKQAQTLLVSDDGFGSERWLALRTELNGIAETGRSLLATPTGP